VRRPHDVRKLAYDITEIGEGERILPTAIVERFATNADGEFEPLTEGSTRRVALTQSHAASAREALRVQPAVRKARRWGTSGRFRFRLFSYSPQRFPPPPDPDGRGRNATAAAAWARLIGRQLFAPFSGRHFNFLARSKTVFALLFIRHFGSPRIATGVAAQEVKQPGQNRQRTRLRSRYSESARPPGSGLSGYQSKCCPRGGQIAFEAALHTLIKVRSDPVLPHCRLDRVQGALDHWRQHGDFN
jgi:hypothetical protein